MSTPRLLLFGDQTVEKLDAIRKLVDSSKNSPTLRRFLREATDVVQYEVSKLSPSERASFYSFDDLLALAEHNAAEETPNEVCATTLICIVRIGELLLYGISMAPCCCTLTKSQIRRKLPGPFAGMRLDVACSWILHWSSTGRSSTDVCEFDRLI